VTEDLLLLACDTAVAAGNLLVDLQQQAAVAAEKPGTGNVVTDADYAAEALIRERISASRPADRILAEEGGTTGGPADVVWIVDPLDGTTNYLYGLPAWSVSIAAVVSGAAAAAAVYVPARGELFSATRGGGATRQGAGGQPVRLRCSQGVPLGQALVATGFGYHAGERRLQGTVLAQVLPQVRDIRRFGSAAMDLCYVAAGRWDAYFETGLELWDIAAGGLIAREAGAMVGGLHGQPAGKPMIMAAAPPLFGALHDLVVAAYAGQAGENDQLPGH
jgi:myo-inositol-1(or 4)-monophosphatase